MPLPVTFGIRRGWSVGPGQLAPPSGAPVNVLTYLGQPLTYQGQYLTYGAASD